MNKKGVILQDSSWIQAQQNSNGACPVFRKIWSCQKTIKEATLTVTSLGVYEAIINGKRIGDYVLAPGWTSYEKRLQYQTYDIKELLDTENNLQIYVGKGWFSSPIPGWTETEDKKRRAKQPNGMIAKVHIKYADGSEEVILSDETWQCAPSHIMFSEIYDGESFDARGEIEQWEAATLLDWSKDILIPQEGEMIKEQERIGAKSVFTTPAGETVVDFGQEITGYVEFTLEAKSGEEIKILHGEVLDKDGNFYNDNYRSAKAQIHYICKDGVQTWHPRLTFFGFRYLKLVDFPGAAKPEQFTAIAVYSDIKPTGKIVSSNKKLNQLFSNIVWGQKGNFLDIPTDCPQRDERLGWTGDAQVFVKAASYNFDVERFFQKWLRDLAADQREDGSVGQVIPDCMPENAPSAAWGDAAVICPWQIYMTYGNKEVLNEQFPSMKKWVDYITGTTDTEFLWTGGEHYGDWLGLDAPAGSYKGSSREEFIASAFYAYSTKQLIKAGKVIGEEVSEYEALYENIVKTFNIAYPTCMTQTEYILLIWFELTNNPQKAADELAEMIVKDGKQMKTGFVGTPYILHVLSKYGYTELAYTLLLREDYPSWLYSVNKGATTIWEHWDGIMENGEFWSIDMNSFNHYAYGAVADWIYEEAAGIQVVEEAPGFAQVRIAPKPDKRLEWLEAEIETRAGKISSKWTWVGEKVRVEIETASPAYIVIGEQEQKVAPGRYCFWGV